jgi:hypothetical protein
MNNFGVFLDQLKLSEDEMVEKIRHIVRQHQCEVPDAITLTSALTAIGHILIDSSGDPRPSLKVEVSF